MNRNNVLNNPKGENSVIDSSAKKLTYNEDLLFLKFMIDCIGRDIETDINKNVAKNDFRYALLFRLSKMYFELLNS